MRRGYDRDEILNAISSHDKIALAKSWGLRIPSEQANAKGWVACHAIDRRPSASFSVETESYHELREGLRHSFFDLAAALGQYPNWQDAMTDLGHRYLGPSRAGARTRTR